MDEVVFFFLVSVVVEVFSSKITISPLDFGVKLNFLASLPSAANFFFFFFFFTKV